MAMNFSEELVYSKSVSAHGNYKYLRIVPVGSTQNPTLSLTSTTQTQFELPNNVMNLARSKLCFDLNIAAAAAGVCHNVHGNALSLIDRITLTSRSGTILADIPNTHIFGNLVSAVNTKLSDLLTRTPIGSSTMTMAGDADAGLALGKSQLQPVGDIVRCNGSANYQIGTATAGLVAYTPNTEPIVLYTGAAAVNTAISYQIELSAFKDTLMELNKNIYFGDNIVLTINWNSATKFSFTTTTTATLTGAATATIVPTLSNLFLYNACETDPTIISQLVSSVNNGEFSIIIPYVYCQKYAAAASTSSTIQQRLNSTYGSTLLRVYFGLFNNGETDKDAYTHYDTTLVSYNTYLDGLRLQDFLLSVADGTTWLYNERNFKNSAMQSIKQHKGAFVHVDNWCGASPCENDDSSLNGLSLDSDRTWSVQTTTTNTALKYYGFFTTQKKLVISRGVLSIV